MLILTRRTAPPAAVTTFSRIGPSCLHGPHHGAQKSKITGTSRDVWMTSVMKLFVSLSLIRLSAPVFCALVPISPDNKDMLVPYAAIAPENVRLTWRRGSLGSREEATLTARPLDPRLESMAPNLRKKIR